MKVFLEVAEDIGVFSVLFCGIVFFLTVVATSESFIGRFFTLLFLGPAFLMAFGAIFGASFITSC